MMDSSNQRFGQQRIVWMMIASTRKESRGVVGARRQKKLIN
jgi:hypothetical protein